VQQNLQQLQQNILLAEVIIPALIKKSLKKRFSKGISPL
jgi:hypothetical protein